jgi:hypothetical protein
MFLVTAALTASGAVVPGAVAIIAPIALGFAVTYGINPVLMGLLVVNGVTERNNLDDNAMLLFVSSFVFNLALSIVVFLLFGGRDLLRRRVETTGRFERRVEAGAEAEPARAGLRLQAADAVGDEHGRHRPTDRLVGVRGARLALTPKPGALKTFAH